MDERKNAIYSTVEKISRFLFTLMAVMVIAAFLGNIPAFASSAGESAAQSEQIVRVACMTDENA